jgi:NADH dehydrogenase FAD-containing subunit
MSKAILVKKKVLVIGYGGAGSKLTAELAKKSNLYAVTVLTPFDYMEVSLQMTKVIATGTEEHSKVLFPLLREDGVEYVIDYCASIDATQAVTASGETIPFDVCVIAVGQRVPFFFPTVQERTVDSRKATISALYSDIMRANSIVIAGGGPIGTEAAADIKLRHKTKK